MGFDSGRSGGSPWLCGWSILLCSHFTKASSSASRSLLSVLQLPLPESPAPTLLSGRLLLAIAQNDRGGGRRLERSTREGTDVASRWRQSVNAGNGQVCSLRRWRVPWPAGESKRGGADFGVKASEFYNASGETKCSVCGLHVNDDR